MSAELEFSLEDHSEEVLKAKKEAVELFLTEAGLHLSEQSAKALRLPPERIDTGLLKNSVTFALSGEPPAIQEYHADNGSGSGTYSGTAPNETGDIDAVYVGTNVEYAVYVHDGTRKMEANPFIANAFNANKDQLESKLKEKLEQA